MYAKTDAARPESRFTALCVRLAASTLHDYTHEIVDEKAAVPPGWFLVPKDQAEHQTPAALPAKN